MADFHCSFCGRARKEVTRLVSGPMVFICDACHASAELRPIARCSFCMKSGGDLRGLQPDPSGAAICEGCLKLAGEFIAEG
jgi:ATP-dependent protease Clp ATPase subunit